MCLEDASRTVGCREAWEYFAFSVISYDTMNSSGADDDGAESRHVLH